MLVQDYLSLCVFNPTPRPCQFSITNSKGEARQGLQAD